LYQQSPSDILAIVSTIALSAGLNM